MWQRVPPCTRPTIAAAPSTSGAPETPGRPSMLAKTACGRSGSDGQRPRRARRAVWERGAGGGLATRLRRQREQHDESDSSSRTRHRIPPYDGPGRLLFGRRERDDVVEARVVDAPNTVRLPGENVDEARPPRDVARLVAMERVDGLGEVLVVAHERDHDLRLRGPEGGGGRAVE